MEVVLDTELGIAVKRAESDADRRRLGREAAILGTVAHPGVVRLVGPPANLAATDDGISELRLELAAGGDVRHVGNLTVCGATGLGAAVATTVADLHHLGVSHGRIDDSHVLLDAEGRPILCGFGEARWLPPGPEGADLRRADIRAVAGLVSDRVGRAGPRRLAWCLRRARGAGCRGDGRWFARCLIAAVPESHLPGRGAGSQTVEPARTNSRRSAVVLAAAAVVVTAIAAGVAGWQWIAGHRHGTPTGPATACPSVDQGCGPLPAPGGIVTVAGSRYFLGPGEVPVVGRWTCGPSGSPAVLQVATGAVWIFDGWPTPARPTRARFVGRYPTAVSLDVLPSRSGCDALRVVRAGQAAIIVPPTR